MRWSFASPPDRLECAIGPTAVPRREVRCAIETRACASLSEISQRDANRRDETPGLYRPDKGEIMPNVVDRHQGLMKKSRTDFRWLVKSIAKRCRRLDR